MNGRFLLVMLGLALGAGSVRAGDSRPVWVFFDEAAVAAGFVATADDPAVGLDPPVVAATTRADGLRAAALAAAATTGAHLRHVSRWLDAASFDATPAQERALAALPGVGHVQPVARGQRPEPVPTRPLAALPVPDKAAATDLDYGYNLPGMLQVNVPLVHALGLRGRGVVVGVMDGGFDTGHEAFQGLVVLGAWDFVNGDPVVADEPGDPMGADAHGTMVLSALAARKAGHLMGPAPDVAVLLAKTEDAADEQPIEEDHWVAGLEWLEANGADVVTSSLIYYDWYDFADLDGHTAVTTRAAAAAAARGVLILNAAGNNRTTTGTLGAPADADSIITVGAVSTGGSTTWFSSPGPTADGRIKPDVAAQGLNNPVADPVDPFAYLEASGTSFATPLVAGVAALVLERAPGLTNLQVRDALRETASHPGAPDNDQGWGVIDALAAVRYWGPVFAHLPVPDTEDPGGPFGVGAMATAVHGLDEASLVVRWRAAGGAWQTVPLVPTGGGPVAYFAEIPGQPSGTVVDYYLEGTDLAGVTVTEPVRAPTRLHTFRVGPDTTPPVISHVPLGNQALSHWPPTVRCTATDNLGVMSVMLYWSLNGGPVQGPVGLLPMGGDDAWVLQPNWGAGVAAGDHVAYWLTATDRAAAANTTTTAQYDIQVLAVADDDTVLTDSPGQFIPDGTASGLVRVLFLDAPATPTVLDVQVGIALTHPAPEQLKVVLYGPDGTSVTLHDHGGAGTTDLVGTWPVDLAVSGPGSLADLALTEANGPWVLEVVDDVPGGFGVLQSWSLALTLTPAVTPAEDVPPPAPVSALGATPNPFNPSTVLHFALAGPGRVDLAIYDIRGMLVRRLLQGDLPAGPQDVAWDGADQRGRAVASGLYLARLEAAGVVRERKLTLVR